MNKNIGEFAQRLSERAVVGQKGSIRRYTPHRASGACEGMRRFE